MTLDELRARATIERGGYSVFDGELAHMSVTLEDAEFLYALVRLAKPETVLELGTGYGVSARFIAEALKANGRGKLTTVEPDAELRIAARKMLKTAPAAVVVAWADLHDLDWDIVFIDSGYRTREDDIAAWLSNGYHGLVVVHDANRDYVGLHGATGTRLPGVDGLWIGKA